MRKTTKISGEKIVKDIKRATRKHYSPEEKIRIVLDRLRGEDSIAELCRQEGILQGIYHKWSKDVRRQGFWGQWQLKLRESLAHRKRGCSQFQQIKIEFVSNFTVVHWFVKKAT